MKTMNCIVDNVVIPRVLKLIRFQDTTLNNQISYGVCWQLRSVTSIAILVYSTDGRIHIEFERSLGE